MYPCWCHRPIAAVLLGSKGEEPSPIFNVSQPGGWQEGQSGIPKSEVASKAFSFLIKFNWNKIMAKIKHTITDVYVVTETRDKCNNIITIATACHQSARVCVFDGNLRWVIFVFGLGEFL